MSGITWFKLGRGSSGGSFITSNNRGMSPVIAVVLLLAITVTLAAVAVPVVFGSISAFESDTPNAQFSFFYEEDVENLQGDEFGMTTASGGDGVVTVKFQRGEAIDPANIEVRAETSGGNLLSDTSSSVYDEGDRVEPGDEFSVVIERGETVRVIWNSPDGDSSATLGSFTMEGPLAES